MRGLFQTLLNGTAMAVLAGTLVWIALLLTAPVEDAFAGAKSVVEPNVPDTDTTSEAPPKVSALFGEPEITVAAPNSPPTEPAAPETLPYVIKGLVVSSERSWAIIDSNEPDLVITTGDVLDDGAFVSNIDADGVHLVVDGRDVLVAPQDVTRTITRTVTAEEPPELVDAEIVFRIGRIDEAEVTRMIARGGKLGPRSEVVGGIPVIWVRKGQFLDKLGLNVGDVIISVAGAPVSSLSDGEVGRTAVENEGLLSFDVRQGDERRKIVVSFVQT